MTLTRPAFGVRITCQAKGALPNGTLVRKTNSVSGDTHTDGALATVIGSIGTNKDGYVYCVVWQDKPDYACFISFTRVEVANDH